MFPEYGGPGPGASLASAFSNAFQKSTGLAQERRRQTQAEELQRAMLAMQGVQYDPEGFKAPASPVAPIVNPLEAGQDQLDQRFEGAQQMGPPSAGNLATGVPYGRKPGAFDPQMGRFTPPTPEVQPPAAQGPPPHEYEPLTPHYRLDRTMLQQRREQALADKLREVYGEKGIEAHFRKPDYHAPLPTSQGYEKLDAQGNPTGPLREPGGRAVPPPPSMAPTYGVPGNVTDKEGNPIQLGSRGEIISRPDLALAGGGEGGQSAIKKALLGGSVNEMRLADKQMQEYEESLSSGRVDISGLSQFLGSIGSSFSHDDPASRTIQVTALAVLNRVNPNLATYIRNGLSYAEGEVNLTNRPSDFRTKMAAFLSTAASGAPPEMVAAIQRRRTAILEALPPSSTHGKPAVQTDKSTFTDPVTGKVYHLKSPR